MRPRRLLMMTMFYGYEWVSEWIGFCDGRHLFFASSLVTVEHNFLKKEFIRTTKRKHRRRCLIGHENEDEGKTPEESTQTMPVSQPASRQYLKRFWARSLQFYLSTNRQIMETTIRLNNMDVDVSGVESSKPKRCVPYVVHTQCTDRIQSNFQRLKYVYSVHS